MTDRKLAEELCNGALAALIAVEMQVDVLRRQAEANRPIGAELGRIQSLMREEVLKLRELMQQMKAIDVDAQRLLAVLRDMVERFQRETGISARFVTDLDELDMPQRVCRELLRIVQEALVNVRKHSGARHALVRLASAGPNWSFTVEDDGKGFPFEGRHNQQQMEEAGKEPMIIKELVRLIAGELTVESHPGHGTRLEITVPRNPPQEDADTAGFAVKKPRSPNLNSGSAAASLDDVFEDRGGTSYEGAPTVRSRNRGELPLQ